MAATDDELQKLGRLPIYNGKEDEWAEWSFVMRIYVSLLSRHMLALLAGAEDPTSPDMSMAENQSHPHRRCVCSSSPQTLPRPGHERERTCTGTDLRNHGHERRFGMAGVDHEIRTKHSAESTKPHERDPECEAISPQSSQPMRSPWTSGKKTFASENRFLETRFNVSMKKALFLDKAPIISASPTPDAKSGPARQRSVSSRGGSDAQQEQEGTRRHGDRCLDKQRQESQRQGKAQN